MAYAFRALAQRALTEHELRARLARRGADEAATERVLARLREFGYVNDAQVARAATERRGVGAMRVRAGLARRGIDRDTIDEAIGARDADAEREDLDALVARNLPRWRRAKNPRSSAFGFLARRGYAAGQIFEALARVDLRPGPDDGDGTPPEDDDSILDSP